MTVVANLTRREVELSLVGNSAAFLSCRPLNLRHFFFKKDPPEWVRCVPKDGHHTGQDLVVDCPISVAVSM